MPSFRFSLVILLNLAVLVPSLRADDANLRVRIDGLIQSSTVVGVNRGWSSLGTSDVKKGVRFDLRLTAARGLILLRAAKLTGDPAYLAAADGVSRALAAAQQHSGYVPLYASFLRAGARAEVDPSPILTRSATDAATAFWLTYEHLGPTTQPRAQQSARIALNWTLQQQLGVGGFLAPTTQPNTGLHPVRQIDLTSVDYRNSVLTLLLASRLEPTKPIQLAAEKAANRLLALRLMNQAGSPATRPAGDDTDEQRKTKAALQLWAARYEAAGEIANDATQASLAASSQALQTLLAEELSSPNSKWEDELHATATALKTLKIDDNWPASVAALPTTQPSTEPVESVFHAGPVKSLPGTFELPAILELINPPQPQAGDDVIKRLTDQESLEDRLAATICGIRLTMVQTADTQEGRIWDAMHP